MEAEDFGNGLSGGSLTKEQETNLRGIREISREFHHRCGIPPADSDISTSSLVLESGHQPNFLPHSGVFRKVYLLDWFAKKLQARGADAVPLFGFADYNLSTANLLNQNRIPETNRDGFYKIGFPLGQKDRWKRFDKVPKPDSSALQKQLTAIRASYERNCKRAKLPFEPVSKNLQTLASLMEDAHRRADSFAAFNAYTIAKTCTDLLGLKVAFFAYSDVQEGNLLIEAAQRLATRHQDYNKACNESVRKRGLEAELGVAEEHFFPFWLHCECGGKTTLNVRNGQVEGKCPLCGTHHMLSQSEFTANYPLMAPTAIARNIIFSEGLGTTLFMSGSGGGLRYGAVANDVSDAMGFRKPITLSWSGADRYLGAARQAALADLSAALSATRDEMASISLSSLAESRRKELQLLLDGAKDDKKKWQTYSGQIKNIETQMNTAAGIFTLTPSFLDVYVNNAADIPVAWKTALESSEAQTGEFAKIKADIKYYSDPKEEKMANDIFKGLKQT
ncbi:MAG: hypothetical protein V1875_06830 [Candidatus Altiarchaeota archaeon]